MRYMHNLHVAEITGDNLFDEFGNFVETPATMKLWSKCRFESSGAGQKVSNEDGAQMVASGIIYLEHEVTHLQSGSYIEVRDDFGRKLISGNVLRFSRDNHNCRIWV